MNVLKILGTKFISLLERIGETTIKIINPLKVQQYEMNLNAAETNDAVLIKIANEILLTRQATVSNGGGGFENVKLIECKGIVFNEYHNCREVYYNTDDDWISAVYYKESDILRMYEEYKRTGELPEL
jgi:hypothetical protein